MRLTELARVDSKGRLMVPATIRDAFGISAGAYLMVIGDVESGEIKLIPFGDPTAKLVEISVALADLPGALAKAAAVLAECRVDLLSTQSRTLHRGRTAEWRTIADVSKCNCKLSQLKNRILHEGAAREVEVRPYP
ncbi:MAG: hypothetical protein ACE5PO_05110 [Candidatus Bathyarchaeia archaeon]